MSSSRSITKARDVGVGRSRSFGGCATCRTRHVKCDEGRPACLMCRHSGITCGGYERTIYFTSEQEDGAERFRRPLFTEQERQRMSASLVCSVPPKLGLANVLAQIEEECEQAETALTGMDIHRGPFGAFKVGSSNSIEVATSYGDLDILSLPAQAADAYLAPSTVPLSFSFQASDPPNEFVGHSGDPQDAGTGILPIDFDQQLTDTSLPPYPSFTHSTQDFMNLLQLDYNSLQETTSNSLIEPLSTISTRNCETALRTAVTLLKHYSSQVIGILTPSKHTKTLWHVLFLSHVKHTVAALSMDEQLDHASLGCFYGTLAISAFHLATVSQSEYWHREGRQFKHDAREHIRWTVRTAYNIPKVAKYKSILMALLTMAQLSMFDGDWKQTECYLLESEKFIRLRGLHGWKSRKRRLLHHCYAFMRLLHESLFMTGTNSLQRVHVRLAVERSGLVVAGSDRPTFRLWSWKNLVQRMLEVKGANEGENDLHLERPGYFKATMYPEIYGLPEEWLVMLSQVIRLGNEKDPQQDGIRPLSLKEFVVRAKDLEQCIIHWQRPTGGTSDIASNLSDVDDRILQPLLSALHQALLIYFYRRIYDVDVSTLQDRVRKVRDSLLECDEADPGRVCQTSIFMWSAFIAGCEAESGELHSTFVTWFENCSMQSGQSAFRHMYSILQSVWHHRSESRNAHVTWLDYLKD